MEVEKLHASICREAEGTGFNDPLFRLEARGKRVGVDVGRDAFKGEAAENAARHIHVIAGGAQVCRKGPVVHRIGAVKGSAHEGAFALEIDAVRPVGIEGARMERPADGPGVAREVDAEDCAPRIRVVGVRAPRGIKAVGILAAVPDHFIRDDLVIHRDSIDSYTDREAAREVALDFYASGCAITFAHAGEAGLGALEAADLADKYAIGIDSDQDSLYPGHIITSLLKHYDRAAFSFIEAAVRERFHGLYLMNLGNYGIEFTEMKVLKEYLGAYTVNALFNELHILRRSLVQKAISLPYPGYYAEARNYE